MAVPVRVERRSPGTFHILVHVEQAGNYALDIVVRGRRLPECPLPCRAFDASRIQLAQVPEVVEVGKPAQFHVDASRAGEGQLEISVNHGEVPNQVEVLSSGKCIISFVPEKPTNHIVEIRFNGVLVPCCPLEIRAQIGRNTKTTSKSTSVEKASNYRVDLSQLELVPADEPVSFAVRIPGGKRELIRVSVLSPSRNSVPVSLKAAGYEADVVTVEFTPKQVGVHVVNVEYNGQSLDGTPANVRCFDSRLVQVMRAPNGAVGETVEFVVDASSSGEGNLEITVNAGEVNVPTQVRPLGGAKFAVCFVPQLIVPHQLCISFNQKSVPGSPFSVIVSEIGVPDHHPIVSVMDDDGLCSAVNCPAKLLLQGSYVSPAQLFARVTNPDGSVVPFSLRESQAHYNAGKNGAELVDEQLAVEFTPAMAGEYRIEVRFRDQPLAGSPFIWKVYDVSRICVSQIPAQATVGSIASFLVETAGAGPGNLEVIVNRGRVATNPQAQSASLYSIHFTPQEAGPHEIDVNFNGENVPGSPFTCQVVDLSCVSAYGDGVDRCPVNSLTTFKITTAGQDIGQMAVGVSGPGNDRVPAKMVGNPQIGYTVEYTPTEVGDYLVDLRVNQIPVPGSPFICKVYDPLMVRVEDLGEGTVGRPLYFSIDASAAGAGNLEIIVSVGGRNVPNYVQSEGNARFRVNFKPSEPLVHSISVKFNGAAVPGSPFNAIVHDCQQSPVSGSELRMTSVARGARFVVHSKGSDQSVHVKATAPSGSDIPVALTKNNTGDYSAEFHPREVGPQRVEVLLGGEHVAGSPFVCNVYDVNKVVVSGLTRGIVGKPVVFLVDASAAGEGTLELVVSTRQSSVRAEESIRARGVYNMTFLPTQPVPHFVNITFNDEDVPGNPFRLEVAENHQPLAANGRREKTPVLEVRGEKTAVVDVLSTFDIQASYKIDARITTPSETLLDTSTVHIKGNAWRVDYTPKEIGAHTVEILHNNQRTKIFHVAVFDPSKVRVFDLEDGIVNKRQQFRVDTTRAGKGQLYVAVTAHGKTVQHQTEELAVGVHRITFTPVKEHSHSIEVKFNGIMAPQFPKVIGVRDSARHIIVHGTALKSAPAWRPSRIYIDTAGRYSAEYFDIVVSSPTNQPCEVKLFSQVDSNLLAQWTPTEIGPHIIKVEFQGKNVHGSPFTAEVFDATKVRLEQVKSRTFNVNEKISIALNRRDAGYAELDVTVTSPLGRNLPIEVKGSPDGEVIEFTPAVSGKYRIAINYGGQAVPGSPVTFIANDSPNVPRVPQVSGPGLTSGQEGTLASFRVDGRGLRGMPEISVETPSGDQAKLKIDEVEEGLYAVSYLPLESGIFDIHIQWNGCNVPHSPFRAQILASSLASASNGTSARPTLIGGWKRFLDETTGALKLLVGEETSLTFEIPSVLGEMVAELDTPNGMRIPVNVERLPAKDGIHRLRVYFTPIESGDYVLLIVYDGMQVPPTPVHGHAVDPHSPETVLDPEQLALVLVKGSGLAQARVGERAEFVIDGSALQSPSRVPPRAELRGQQGQLSVHVTPMASNNTFRAHYTPTHVGAHQLSVWWDGVALPESPFRVQVETQTTVHSDASKVTCSGEGLAGGVVGTEIRAFIDTRRGGPGELTTHCTGPTKMAHCELYDHRDGTFTLFVKPQEGGKHLLNVKYGGDHVPGSPYTMKICGAPDASRVRVYGPGIEAGVLARYQSRFVCDTRGAGAGQLTVRIRGPKGAFRVEMARESHRDRTILCKYDPTEPGDYRIEVRWSGEHVPGSPFVVLIFDTAEELIRHLQSQQAHQPQPPEGLPPPAPMMPMLGH
ncbi:filamin-C-like isoform X2 [Varroa jacobsoni]|nr:filamin-C-like isoform X2 [Varroa jacobsoni]